ncbi:probable ATP-dependent DNA helicase RecQ [Ricinus communis]|uniref:probable ATP-dependent DNA helicase RecQ n=1 Tax=Ricinus communis TaxID=3988 RepID=UPI00201A3F06|nr:probable ATP-dependent DNA helicase RecQ [Ricinus communis]
MESALKKYFGFSGFRPYQKEVIEKILERKDCLVVMATGSGKSLCYQVPPLVAGKTAVVISPLISLMQDQVMALKQRGIRAEYLGTGQTDHSVHNSAQNGHFNLLFVTPEKACSLPVSFWSSLLKVGVCLLAVDEAHCISEWGHDFRVEYKQLYKLRNILLDVPFVGLTATATAKVRFDIINSLKMNDPYISVGSFDRKNLFYGVKHFNRGSQFMDELVQEISKFVGNGDSTIIYCTTVKDVEQVFQLLQQAGIRAGIYHGQMGNKAREESHKSFIRDELHVMVATIAFGMGIDKPNIRQVIHYGCPKSLESYYQESGRCGRDGIPSVCWLYYTGSDFAKGDFYCGENQRKAIMESLMAAKKYCTMTTCRRKFLLEYFGERFLADKCGNCDNCTVSKRERDLSKEAFLLLACIKSCRGNWGLNLPIDVLRGSRAKRILDMHFDKLPLHGLGKGYSSNWWKALANQLICHGYLMETIKDVYKFVSVHTKGEKYLSSARPDYQPPLVLPLTDQMVDDEEYQCTTGGVENFNSLATLQSESFLEAEVQLYQKLLEERIKLARSIGTAPYAICGDQTIKRIALTRPSTKARLANIEGVNQHLVAKHGDRILQSIRHLTQELNLSLDGEASLQITVNTRKVCPTPNLQKTLSPAKFEAWKMWHEDGLSIHKIANLPSRQAPIKVETVCEYLLDAAQEGLEFDWIRFCSEIGLTGEIFSDIQGAIIKVGSREKLKPIKNELPEDVSYAHIKTFLAMQTSGMSLEGMQPSHLSPSKDDPVQNKVPANSVEIASLTTVTERKELKPDPIHDEDLCSPEKRQKTIITDGSSTALEATETSILDLLKNYDEGVSLSDILKHFKGSREDSVIDLLSSLEADFMIFKKNNLYRLL